MLCGGIPEFLEVSESPRRGVWILYLNENPNMNWLLACSFLSQHFVCQLHLLKCRLQNVPIQYLANAFSMHDKDHHHIMPLQCSMQWMRGSFSKAKISKNDISLRLINETKVEQHRSSNVIAPNQTVQIKKYFSVSVSQSARRVKLLHNSSDILCFCDNVISSIGLCHTVSLSLRCVILLLCESSYYQSSFKSLKWD